MRVTWAHAHTPQVADVTLDQEFKSLFKASRHRADMNFSILRKDEALGVIAEAFRESRTGQRTIETRQTEGQGQDSSTKTTRQISSSSK